MRILHVPQRYHPSLGGVETYVRTVAEEQARRGHDVEVATSLDPPGSPNRESIGPIPVTRFPVKRFRGDWVLPPWVRMPGLAQHIIATKPDVVHAHGYGFYTVEAAAQARRRAGIPFVVTAHGFHPSPTRLEWIAKTWYDATSGRRAAQAASRCIAIARHEIANYRALGVPESRIAVVHNGLSPAAFERADPRTFREEHKIDGPLVVFLARLAPNKGAVELAHAARQVPDATFAFCGPDGGAEAQARSVAPPNARFIGPVRDPRAALSAADIFCVPSHYEGHSMVLSEAMAQGCAIVTTEAAGNAEIIGDAGLVVPLRDPNALAARIRELLDDPAKRERLGGAAKQRAKRFLWSEIMPQLERVYEAAIAERRA